MSIPNRWKGTPSQWAETILALALFTGILLLWGVTIVKDVRSGKIWGILLAITALPPAVLMGFLVNGVLLKAEVVVKRMAVRAGRSWWAIPSAYSLALLSLIILGWAGLFFLYGTGLWPTGFALFAQLALLFVLLYSSSRILAIAKDRLGWNPLHVAAAHDDAGRIRTLCERGVNLEVETPAHATALSLSVEFGNVCAASALLELGADPNHGCLLLTAVDHANTELVDLLVKHGADVNPGIDQDEYNPLQSAVVSQQAEIVRKLLEAGADANFGEDQGTAPLMLLREYKRKGESYAAIESALLLHGARKHVS